MPIYEFRCQKCQKIFEEFVFSSNASFDDLECPDCNTKNPQKLMSACSASGTNSWGSGSIGSSCGSGGFS